jgi:hypothetical protein
MVRWATPKSPTRLRAATRASYARFYGVKARMVPIPFDDGVLDQ